MESDNLKKLAEKTRAHMESDSLKRLLDEAKARVAALSPEEYQDMLEAQRKSFVRAMTTPCEHGVLDFETCPRCRGWDET